MELLTKSPERIKQEKIALDAINRKYRTIEELLQMHETAKKHQQNYSALVFYLEYETRMKER